MKFQPVLTRLKTSKHARVDHRLKEVSPSSELRKWYGHDVDKWLEFKRRYFKELEKQDEPLARLRELAAHNDVALLSA